MLSFTTHTIDQKSSSTAEHVEPAAAVFSTQPQKNGLTLHTRSITAQSETCSSSDRTGTSLYVLEKQERTCSADPLFQKPHDHYWWLFCMIVSFCECLSGNLMHLMNLCICEFGFVNIFI